MEQKETRWQKLRGETCASKLSARQLAMILGRKRINVLEIGCHNGSDGRALIKAVEYGGILHQFDPDPRHNAQHPIAVGAINGNVMLNVSSGRNNASSSIHMPKEHLEVFPDVKFKKQISVDCVMLDTWYAQNLNPKTIDIVLCDVNGAERDVIAGGWVTLGVKTRFLKIEFEERELFHGALNMQELLNWLPEFELMGVYDFQGNYGNLLLKNKNLK